MIPELQPPAYCEALIFDWDGTLANSQDANYRALAETMRAHGGSVTRDWFDARTGTSAEDVIRLLVSEFGYELDTDMSSILEERERRYLEQLGLVKEISAALDVARQYHGRLPIAVASGASRNTVSATMDALGISRIFGTVITREDVKRGKPAPDLFLLAAARLKVPPSGCVVYEDSAEGMLAARAAGMRAVDVRPYRAEAREARPSHPHSPRAPTVLRGARRASLGTTDHETEGSREGS
jgi:HAD superfamily hydrolase (TIGR01509 family)